MNQATRAIEKAYRQHWGEITSILARKFGSDKLDLIESVVQDAFVKAMEKWPVDGIPENPVAWILAVAKNRQLNSIRDVKSRGKKGTEIEYHLTEVIERVEVADVISLQKGLDDDLLGMFFVCNHPEVPVETLVPLTLRTLCGFETAELARAYLLSEDALKKRLVRGRAQLREFAPKIELPNITEMKVRLDSVLATIYLEQVPGIFSFSLLISVIPQIVGQSYVAFGSASLFDNSFHVAHFLKVISYVVPLTGICLHYVYNLKRERQVVEQVIQSQKLAFLGQLSSGAAHEINNPLTVVRGLNEVLEHNARSGRWSNDNVVRLTGLINQHVDRVVRIVDSLKLLGGETAGAAGDGVTVRDLFGHILDLSKEPAGKFGMTVSAGEVSERIAVVGPRSELIQLLLNLVRNAIDSLEDRDDGRIQPSAYRNLNNQVEISVEDNGPGIAREYRNGLFTPFFTTRDVGRGVGLGLGTALSIAQKLGGDITFERFAPGVKVVLELPLAESTEQMDSPRVPLAG